ncbi:MAG: CinA family nicotinamide mononucleotide deamidase-related protein [Candidatus Cloacimonadaceae bacterium]
MRQTIPTPGNLCQILLKNMSQIKSAIISIGNEILLGKTVNTNLAFLADGLAALGAPVVYNVVVNDDADDITRALDYCSSRYDIVITTGGLGPTHDDITKATIAKYFGKELVFQPHLWEYVQSLFAKRGVKAPEINRNQALVPQDFSVLENAMGTAPGLYYHQSGLNYFACAGVPIEMRYVFETHITEIIKKQFPKLHSLTQHTIHTFGISESALAERLDTSALPPGVEFAWLPQTGRVDLRLYGMDQEAVYQGAQDIIRQIPGYVWGLDEDTPSKVLGKLLSQRKMSISLAESCTGGLVAKMLSDEPGASDYLLGGVVSYHNDIKSSVLGVSKETLATDGAVSEQTVRQMVLGVKGLMDSDCAISVSGIAGPSGGSAEKPVGTVWFGFSYQDEVWAQKYILTGSRESIRHKAAEVAIITMIKKLISEN